ncbi:MAG: phospholipase [Synechococcaceae cyanobacterium SM2_3_1]|nr:phospholipase [Synechococcaceae cyanobacterium SM2_3_1]
MPPSLSLKHQVRLPLQLSPTAPPLLLLLHGVGSHEEDLMGLAPYVDPRFLVVSARAPRPWGNGGYAWFDITFTSAGPEGNWQQAAESRQVLATFIQELRQTYAPALRRLYLMGFSQGAMMSMYLSLLMPAQVAGMVIMSGQLPPQTDLLTMDPQALQGLPVLVVHGMYDPIIPIAEGRRLRDQLQQWPVLLTYAEYPMEHQVSTTSLQDITRWLTTQLNQDIGPAPCEAG